MVGNLSRSQRLQTKICMSGLSVPHMQSLLQLLGLRKISTLIQRPKQQHVLEHREHNKAQQRAWSSTASGLSSRSFNTVLPLDPARTG